MVDPKFATNGVYNNPGSPKTSGGGNDTVVTQVLPPIKNTITVNVTDAKTGSPIKGAVCRVLYADTPAKTALTSAQGSATIKVTTPGTKLGYGVGGPVASGTLLELTAGGYTPVKKYFDLASYREVHVTSNLVQIEKQGAAVQHFSIAMIKLPVSDNSGGQHTTTTIPATADNAMTSTDKWIIVLLLVITILILYYLFF